MNEAMKVVLTELLLRNRLRHDGDTYEYCLAEWALGIRVHRPNQVYYSVRSIEVHDPDKYIEYMKDT